MSPKTISTTNKCPILSFNVTLAKRSFNSSSVGTVFFYFMQPKGSGLVIAKPYWLFSSILIILDENRLTSPSTVSKRTLSFCLSFRKSSVSKAALVFTQLYPPINIFSKTLIFLGSVGRTILHLLLFL